MIMKVFSVYDSAVGAYMTPFFMQSSGAAIRAFTDIANDLQSAICKHPTDYSLFELGSWDDATHQLDHIQLFVFVAINYLQIS